jgi:hypothetical protein
MSDKYLVTLRKADDAEKVRGTECEVLAEYPDTLLVRCTEAQRGSLDDAGLEVSAIESQPVKMTGMSFSVNSALAADERAPVPIARDRTAYYLVQLVGPPTSAWLHAIQSAGGKVYGTLAGYTYLVGILPAGAEALNQENWVEAVTPYRPAMKISPKLRAGATRELALLSTGETESESRTESEVVELASVTMGETEPDARQRIEVNVFPNESTADIAAKIRDGGGVVISETPTTVVATVTSNAIADIANEPGVQAILPFSFPEYNNDRATVAMGAPVDRVFADLELRGTGQIVGIADSGLDTGDPATVHLDVRGRVVSITSLPTNPFFLPFIHDAPPVDDGPADIGSAHGTHVAGSVLGNGAAAAAAGATAIPRGMAPDAQVHFQATEQGLNWKTPDEVAAEGLNIIWWTGSGATWPPPTFGLYGLPDDIGTIFTAAYAAGARIHTNSWGNSQRGVYNFNSRAVDDFMWHNRDMLILFSAGNNGRDVDGSGAIDADSIGSPGTAKNCLTVGATENNRPSGSIPTPGINGNWSALSSGGVLRWPALGAAGHVSDNIDGLAAFSSRGPVDDGRIKPDIVAPGTNVLSVRSSAFAGPGEPLWGDLAAGDPLNGLYCWSGGTSMSTPLVAGAAALVRQHLVQQRGHELPGVKPSGALIKAMLINGAVPILGQFADEVPDSPPIQNNVSGFGRVSVQESVTPGSSVADALHRTLFADEPEYAVMTGEIRTFEVHAVNLTLPLKVTLVWTDAPSVGAGGLVNRLYLQVVEPDGNVVDGDVAAFPTVNNNVQQVTIPAPVAGTYQIRVRGVDVLQHSPSVPVGPDNRQDFALAVSNAMGPSLQPVSIAQAIDTTSSMNVFGYMEPAKERAAQLTDFLRPTDTLSITEFSHRAIPPDARPVYPQRLLGSFTPDWTEAHAAIAAMHADGLTPIGAGLLAAWNQLNVPLTAGTPRAIVLLSDGLNTFPPAPDDPSVLPTIPATVPIFTIALGPAGSTPTLQNIATSRPGGSYFEVYTDDDIHRLHEIYATLQALAAGAFPIGLQSADISATAEAEHEMLVEDSVEEVSFSLSWRDPGHEVDFVITGPDGQRYDATAAATAEVKGQTYHLVRIAAPKAGSWKLRVSNRKSQKPTRYTVSGAVQSRLSFSTRVNRCGSDGLALGVSLRYLGKPIKDARIVARISVPSLSRERVVAQFKDQLSRFQLPKEVDEPGLKEEERLLTKLAAFAMGFRDKDGGLFGRKTTEVELAPHGEGEWGTELMLTAPGNARIQIVASGKLNGRPWQRITSKTVHIPEAIPKRDERLTVKEIFLRDKDLIGVRVIKSDGSPATPEDGLKITISLKQGTHTAEAPAAAIEYDKPGAFYFWKFAEAGFSSGHADVTTQVSMGGQKATGVTTVNLEIG